LSWFIGAHGENDFAAGANYPLKVAGFDLTIPGWFCPTDDNIHGGRRDSIVR
jgi:hypothetical protein